MGCGGTEMGRVELRSYLATSSSTWLPRQRHVAATTVARGCRVSVVWLPLSAMWQPHHLPYHLPRGSHVINCYVICHVLAHISSQLISTSDVTS
jgi:hypothetical protein